jgi:hypothetical protein
MARWVSRRIALVSTCTALVIGAAGLAWAQSTLRVVLSFDGEALELSSGAVVPGPGSAGEGGGDIVVALNAQNSPHAVVLPARDGIEIAHLTGAAYETVDAVAAASVDFPSSAPDRPFVAGNTVLVRTPEGALFKLGNPSENEAAVSFDCERL